MGTTAITGKKELNAKYWINVAIMLFFYFGFGHLPAIGEITPMGMQILGVFIGMIWAWMFIDMLWPSFLGLIALGLTDYSKNVLTVFQAGVTNKNVILIFLFFVFSQYIESSGLSKVITTKLLGLKWGQGKPWRLVFLILLTTYLLGVFINTYAVIFLMWTIVYDMCKLTGYGKGEKLPGFLLVGIVQVAAISGTIMPYQVFPGVCMNAFQAATGLTVGTAQFIGFNVIVSFLGTLAYYAAGRYLLKVDVSKLKSYGSDKVPCVDGMDRSIICDEVTYGVEQKIATLILVLFVFLILVPGFLSADNPLALFYKKVGDQGILGIVLVLAAGLQLAKGKPLADISKLIVDGVN